MGSPAGVGAVRDPRGIEGEIYIDIEESGRQCRAEVMYDMPEAAPGAVVESCLRSLDEHGFDASGVEQPEHSYHLSVLPGGAFGDGSCSHGSRGEGDSVCAEHVGVSHLARPLFGAGAVCRWRGAGLEARVALSLSVVSEVLSFDLY